VRPVTERLRLIDVRLQRVFQRLERRIRLSGPWSAERGEHAEKAAEMAEMTSVAARACLTMVWKRSQTTYPRRFPALSTLSNNPRHDDQWQEHHHAISTQSPTSVPRSLMLRYDGTSDEPPVRRLASNRMV